MADLLPVPELPSADELDELIEGIASRPSEDEMADVWPVPGLIHPGITCVMGQPERGKTTLLISLCDALLRSLEWLGHPTRLEPDRRVIFFCEDRSSAARVRRAFKGSGLDNRLLVLVLRRWPSGVSLIELVRKTHAGLVIVDSVYPAVGDVNDQARADAFLGAIQPLSVPVVVVHHEGKDGHASPAGVQRFRAAYRHTIRAKRCQAGDGDRVILDLDVSGNDVPGRTAYLVAVDRRLLIAELLTHPEPTSGSTPRRRRAKRKTAVEKATALGHLARDLGCKPDLGHTEYASALLGGTRGHEQPDRQRTAADALGVQSVQHQTVANLIRNNLDAFRAAHEAGSKSAA